MRRLLFRYVNGGGRGHIIWLRTTSSNTQVTRNYNPQSEGTAGTLILWLQVPGMALYKILHMAVFHANQISMCLDPHLN